MGLYRTYNVWYLLRVSDGQQGGAEEYENICAARLELWVNIERVEFLSER